MKIQPYVDKLNSSKEYASFVKENPDAFMAAGFFVIDFEQNHNIHQLDFYVPSKKKIAAFTLDDSVIVQMLDAMNDAEPSKLDPSTNIDLEELKGIVQDEMRNRGFSENIGKMIAILQNVEDKKIWHVNCVLSGMHILKAKVEDSDKSVLEMDKKSMMDFVKKVSPDKLKEMQGKSGEGQEIHSEVAIGGESAKNAEGGEGKGMSAEDIDNEIKKLIKIEEVVEKEKDKLEDLKKDSEDKDKKE